MQLDPITRAVLDAMQEGVLIIDAQERIVYGNRAYVAFLEKEAGGPIGPIEGYPLRLLRPGARLPEVLAQKRPILHTPRQESEDIYFVNMYPMCACGWFFIPGTFRTERNSGTSQTSL